ncbi:MAG: VCBS repeat-containing protein [Candidatus Sabulitectum sp.]|nr:VCBS repeat-containing protein [Candidatus Sabulitectum sp.]
MRLWIQLGVFTLLLSFSVAAADGFEQYTVATGFWAPAGLLVCSINDDEYPDILGAAWNDDEVSYWINSGEVIPQWEEFVVTDSLDGACFVCSGDINNDGFNDIAACGYEANLIICFMGDGGGSWTRVVVSDELVHPHEVHFADIDQDGLVDLLAAGAGATAVSWWKNNGSGPDQWQKFDVCTNMPGGRSVCWGDFDQDGDLDLAGCSLPRDDVRWWENDGQTPPGWTDHLIEGSLDGAHMTRTADIDGDGSLDLATTGYGSGEIAIWFNRGGSTVVWEKHSISGSFGLALGIELVDINNDNLIDLVGTSMGPSQMAVWLNNGGSPSTWNKKIVDGALSGAWPLSSGDLDSDGWIDLVGGANSAGYIRWYRNDIISGINEGQSVSAGFVLGKVSPNPASGSVSVILNRNKAGRNRVFVMDIAGRAVCELFSGPSPAGESTFLWNCCSEDGCPVKSGIYCVVVNSDSKESAVSRITVLR